MHNALIAKTMGIIMLAGAGLSVTSAQAAPNNDGNRDYGYSQPDKRNQAFPNHAPAGHQLREGFHLARLVNARQDNQTDRILAGVESKRLNRGEFVRLMQEQKAIQQLKRSFMHDRFISEAEFRQLDRMLDAADRHIRLASREYWRRNYSNSRTWS